MAHVTFEHSFVAQLVRCPTCHARLERRDDSLHCTASACNRRYPIVSGIPVLVNDDTSLFTIEEITAGGGVHDKVSENEAPPTASLKERVLDALPQLSHNWKAEENFALLARTLLERSPRPRVLVVGGGVLGVGMQQFADHPDIELVESDVFFGPRTALICDALELPFEDGSFDGVIIQGVLGNVADPYRAAEEIHRVLAPAGVLYVETPFVQQVCLGAYDFTRFTHLGLRRLFRSFEVIRSGAQCGPGMVTAWSYQYLLWSFARSHRARVWSKLFARMTGFWLVQLDRFLIDRDAALDAASGVYLLGRKTDRALSDRELVRQYRGGFA